MKGLRREEVAELANIGVTWYTWLEQARPVNVAPATLERIAIALRLEPLEREHLFQLVSHPPPPLPVPDSGDQMMSTLQQILASLEPNPAYVLTPRWDFVAWNRMVPPLFGDPAQLHGRRRNLMWMTFVEPELREIMADWQGFARCVIAHFRADSAAHAGDSRWTDLIDAVAERSAEFRAWWPCHEVAWPLDWTKEFAHPVVGRILLRSVNLDLHRPSDFRVVAYAPVPDTGTEAKLAELLSCSNEERK